MARKYFNLMCLITTVLLIFVEAVFFFGKRHIVRIFTEDEAVANLAESCVYIIMIAFIPDIIQGSL